MTTLQHDEDVGIYGFIFHRDCYWVPVIIDECVSLFAANNLKT